MSSVTVYFVFIFVIWSINADGRLDCLLQFLYTLRRGFCDAGNTLSRIAITRFSILPFRHSEGINESYDAVVWSITHKVVRNDLNNSVYKAVSSKIK